MKKWEYRVCSWFEEIEELGKEGWELVCVTPETELQYRTYFLKRELKPVAKKQ